MSTPVATYTSMSKLGSSSFPIYVAYKEFVDADGYDIEPLSEVLYRGPDKAKALQACGPYGFDNRKFL